MTVVSRNSEGIIVSGDWHQYIRYATDSVPHAREWFAKEATKLGHADNKSVSSVQIQSGTLSYNNVTGTCKATLRGAVYFGQESSMGPDFFDGSALTMLARNEDQRVAKLRANLAAFAAAMSAASAAIAAANAQTTIQPIEYPQYTSPPLTVPPLRMPNAFEEARNFHLSTPPMRGLSTNSSALDSLRFNARSTSPTRYGYSPAPTYAPSNNGGLSSGLATRSGTLSGNTYFHPNGTTSTRVGNTWFHSGGSTSTVQGNTIFHSSGATSKKQGNTWFHSNGTTTTQKGSTFQRSDGTSYTISGSGTLYYNGKGVSGN